MKEYIKTNNTLASADETLCYKTSMPSAQDIALMGEDTVVMVENNGIYQKQNGALVLILPISGETPKLGEIKWSPKSYSNSTAPNGWLACKGESFSQDSYPDLYTYLGSNTMPNYTQCSPIGNVLLSPDNPRWPYGYVAKYDNSHYHKITDNLHFHRNGLSVLHTAASYTAQKNQLGANFPKCFDPNQRLNGWMWHDGHNHAFYFDGDDWYGANDSGDNRQFWWWTTMNGSQGYSQAGFNAQTPAITVQEATATITVETSTAVSGDTLRTDTQPHGKVTAGTYLMRAI